MGSERYGYIICIFLWMEAVGGLAVRVGGRVAVLPGLDHTTGGFSAVIALTCWQEEWRAWLCLAMRILCYYHGQH